MNKQELDWNEGYMDGLSGRTSDKPSSARYHAGYRKGDQERTAAKEREIKAFDAREIPLIAENAKNRQDLVISTELSAYEESIRHNYELREKLIETRQALNDEAVLIIDAMSLALDSKKETMEKLRDYKATVVREVMEVTTAMSRLKELTSDRAVKEQAANLKEFLILCEKLKSLKDSGFLADLADTASKLNTA